MLLVGMLDSPYVRRAAVTGRLLELDFEHRSVSVFRHMEAFAKINPLIKAPSLVCDDGTVITDSNLIIQHFEDVAGRSLRPSDAAARTRDLGLTGIGIVAADKAVSIEHSATRPGRSASSRSSTPRSTCLMRRPRAANSALGRTCGPATSPPRSPGVSAAS
jgi:glutathione S-transferase